MGCRLLLETLVPLGLRAASPISLCHHGLLPASVSKFPSYKDIGQCVRAARLPGDLTVT